MNQPTDAQADLPISPEQLLARLDGWGLRYRLYEHAPLRTVEDARKVEAQLTVPGENAFRIKNLYLRDRKKRNFLVTLHQDRAIDLKDLGENLDARNLSFGSPERLMQHLGIYPGAVSPLAMITGVGAGVSFVLDAAAQAADVIYMHPLVNTRTVAMGRADLMTFLERIGCDVRWLP